MSNILSNENRQCSWCLAIGKLDWIPNWNMAGSILRYRRVCKQFEWGNISVRNIRYANCAASRNSFTHRWYPKVLWPKYVIKGSAKSTHTYIHSFTHTHTHLYTHSYPQPVIKIEATDLGAKAKRDDAFMGQTETLIVPPRKSPDNKRAPLKADRRQKLLFARLS